MPAIDIHCHPGLKTWLFNSNFEDDHMTLSRDFFPTDMAVDYPKMVQGEVDVILSSVYLPESSLINEVVKSSALMDIISRFINVKKKAEYNCSPGHPFEQTLEFINLFEEKLKRAADSGANIAVARNYEQLKQYLMNGTKAVIHSIEGAHSLGRKVDGSEPDYIAHLNVLFEKGVCLMTLAHFYENDIVSPVIGMPPSVLKSLGLSDKRDLNKGLSAAGKKVVEHMLRIGMLVDLAHCTKIAREEVFDINDSLGENKRPLVFSHVGAGSFSANDMNPDDNEIMRIKECGGVIGIIFYNYYLSGREEENSFPDLKQEPGIQYIIDSVKRVQEVTSGFDNIAIGSDLDGFTDPCDDLYNTSCFHYLRKKLKNSFGQAAAGKILGNNFMRVLKTGWGNSLQPVQEKIQYSKGG